LAENRLLGSTAHLGQGGCGQDLIALINAVTAGFSARPAVSGLAEAGVKVEMSDQPVGSRNIANTAWA